MIYKGEITLISDGRDHGRLGRAREFIEIGGARVHNIICSDYVNTFLNSDSGEFVLSTVKRGGWQIVMAIRRPNGELIKDKGQLKAFRAARFHTLQLGLLFAVPAGFLAESFLVFLILLFGLGGGYWAVKYFKASEAANALDTQT